MSTHRLPFVEANKEAWTLERERLLANKITDLGLRIEGTYLEGIIQRLYAELDQAGFRFKPRVYLSDEWACPDRVAIIGIPYGRVDMRVRHKSGKRGGKAGGDDSDWEFFVIEVNPNPYLEEHSEVAMVAKKHDMGFADLIERIIDSASRRHVVNPPA